MKTIEDLEKGLADLKFFLEKASDETIQHLEREFHAHFIAMNAFQRIREGNEIPLYLDTKPVTLDSSLQATVDIQPHAKSLLILTNATTAYTLNTGAMTVSVPANTYAWYFPLPMDSGKIWLNATTGMSFTVSQLSKALWGRVY